MFTAVFLTFLPFISGFFFSRIIVNIMEFDATDIQVRGLASYKLGSNHHFLHNKMYVPSQEHDSCYPFI